jgi:hypothetical protein
VPYRRLDSWDLTPSAAGPDFHNLVLMAGTQVVAQPFLDHPAPVIAALGGRDVLPAEPQGEVVGAPR